MTADGDGEPSFDLSDLEALNSTQGRNRCTVGVLIGTLPPDLSAKLVAALARPAEGVGKIEHAAISRWLDKMGHHFPSQTIGRHRHHQCGCPR